MLSLVSLQLLCPWNFLGKNTGVGCRFLLQGISLAQGLNLWLLCLLNCTCILYPLSYWGNLGYNSLYLLTQNCGRKAMPNLDSILKSRDITLPKKVHIVKAMVFLVVMYGWMWESDHKEGWEPRIDAFKLWCRRRLLRVPWTARRSSQSILKEINPECSLEELMLKLKL